MPTSKPRVSITLDASDLAVVDRFCLASGQQRASALAGMITAAVPEMEKAARLMELAREAPDKVKRDLVHGMANATADAMGLLQGTFAESEKLLGRLGKRAGSTRRGAPLAGGQPRPVRRKSIPKDPHLLTGGSKP